MARRLAAHAAHAGDSSDLFLADTIAKVKREDTKPFQDGKPAYFDKIEWFASAGDLCRLMN